MEYNDFSRITSSAHDRELEMAQAFPVLMRKVYTWMTLALIITGITAYGVSVSPSMAQMLYMNGVMPIIIMGVAELGIVIYLSSRLQRLSLTSATVWFIIFSLINGLELGWIFMAFTTASIAKTFFITAGMFGVMAFIGYTTKKDLSKMGSILLMALIGLIIAMVVNIFIRSSWFDLVISGIGVILFTGLTAWDVQSIKKVLQMAPDASESVQKIALLGALNLYLDFINLFLYLLRFFGNSND